MKTFLNYKLDILSVAAKREADEIYLRECELDVNHLRLLRLIHYNPGIGPSELADKARLDRPKTSRMLTRLTDKGFVEKCLTEGDGRQVRLKMSDKGQALVTKANDMAMALERALLTPLTESQQANLSDWLDKLTEWVESGGLARSYGLTNSDQELDS
ncbi:TPA: MarR family winged helix-turn-helix transcriptional regulator [Klebsiella oxytoca]